MTIQSYLQLNNLVPPMISYHKSSAPMQGPSPDWEIRFKMYAPPEPLSQECRVFTSNCSNARAAERPMTEKAVHKSAAPLWPDTQISPRHPRYTARLVKQSLLNHPALRVVLAVGCLALALPYTFAFTPPVRSAPVASTAVSLASDVSFPDVRHVVDTASAAAEPATAKEPLQILQKNFDPVLLERLEIATPATVADVIKGAEDAPVVTAEKLRILAQMTPEQIDALTFLILSQQDPNAAAAAVDQTTALAEDAPWVGDWESGDLSAESADLSEGIAPLQNELLTGWYVFEASADEAVIRHIDDPLSAVRVSPGTVLGNLGLVSEIRIEAGRAKVVLSTGDVIPSDDSAIILAEDVANVPMSYELRRGPPFEAALSASQTESPVAPADEAVASDDGTKDMVDPVLTSPSVVTAQTTSAKSVPEETAAQSGADTGRYVQVATFRSAANAQTARDMVVSDGMAGQLRLATLQGDSFHLVLAGPFDPAEIQSALSRVTRLGFRDAFITR
jgi:cell division septation protein DedD